MNIFNVFCIKYYLKTIGIIKISIRSISITYLS